MVICISCKKTIRGAPIFTCAICTSIYHAACIVDNAKKGIKEDDGFWECDQCIEERESEGFFEQVMLAGSGSNVTFSTLVTELKYLLCDNRDLKGEVTKLKSLLRKCDDRIDALECMLNRKVDNFIHERDVEMSTMRYSVMDLRRHINDEILTITKKEIEVLGFPETETEDIMEIMMTLARYVGMELEPDDLELVTRVRPNSAHKFRHIVVRFLDPKKRNAFLLAALSKCPIYIDDIPEFRDNIINQKLCIRERLIRDFCGLYSKCFVSCHHSSCECDWAESNEDLTSSNEYLSPVGVACRADDCFHGYANGNIDAEDEDE